MAKWRKLLLVYKLQTLLVLALLLNSYKVKARAICWGSGCERTAFRRDCKFEGGERMETKSNAKLKAMFIIPSITGIILFMIPVKNAAGDWTVVVKILADIISGAIGGFLPLLCVLILTVSAVMSLIALAKPKFIMNNDIMKECFACKPIWVVIRVLAAIFVWLTYLGVGEEDVGLVGMITGGGQGGFVLYDLLTTLVIIFVIDRKSTRLNSSHRT